MSIGSRGDARRRMLRRVGLTAGALALLALVLLITGHWVIGLVCAVAAVAGIWLFLQLRTVR